MRTCDQHPLVTVSVTGEAREDGGGLSGPQLVRLRSPMRAGQDRYRWWPSSGTGGTSRPCQPGPGRSASSRWSAICIEEQFRREILFYQDVHSHLQGLRLPRVYYVAMTDAPSVSAWSYVLFDTRTPLRFCLLLEDLAVDHFAAVPLGASLPFPQAKQALLNIAQPAFGWQQPRLWAQLHLRPTPWLTFLRADEGLQRRQRDVRPTNVIPTFLHRWAQSHPPAHARGVSMLQEPEG